MRQAIRYLILALLVSCGAASTPGDPLGDAWQKFVDGDYAGAHQGFEGVLNTQASQGYAGLGWVSIKLDSLPEADRYFGLSVSFGDTLPHTMAGWSVVGWQKGDYALSIYRADYVLRTVPAFIFQYDSNATKNALILTQANDYFHLGQVANCIERIHQLDNTFNPSVADPNITVILLNKLDALDAALRM